MKVFFENVKKYSLNYGQKKILCADFQAKYVACSRSFFNLFLSDSVHWITELYTAEKRQRKIKFSRALTWFLTVSVNPKICSRKVWFSSLFSLLSIWVVVIVPLTHSEHPFQSNLVKLDLPLMVGSESKDSCNNKSNTSRVLLLLCQFFCILSFFPYFLYLFISFDSSSIGRNVGRLSVCHYRVSEAHCC